MRLFHSFSAKIILGYCLVGGLFIVLIASALLQFHSLQRQLDEQRKVTIFFDAIRHARRLEKNFLLYRKPADLVEAIDKALLARNAFIELPTSTRAVLTDPERIADVERYRELLVELSGRTRYERIPQAVQDDLFVVGAHLTHSGEMLDEFARQRLSLAVNQHEHNLLSAILAAVLLALATGFFVSRSILRPLRDIEQRLEQVAKGETGRLEDENEGDSEVRSLQASINSALIELEKRQQAVSRSSRLVALGTMLSGVAHELNNPLSNISSSCQLLIEEEGAANPEQSRRLLAQIDDQVLRAQRIVSALLDFSRDRAFHRQPEALNQLVSEALLLVRSQLPADIRLEIKIPPEMNIDVDRQRFQQVLVNLIKNAAEAIGSDGHIRLSAWRESLPEGHGTSVEIEDSGHGIAPADLVRIFDPFFTTKPVGQGTGLGLFVAHEIVSQHGGTLSVNSTPGRGTCFWMHIPDLNSSETAHE